MAMKWMFLLVGLLGLQVVELYGEISETFVEAFGGTGR